MKVEPQGWGSALVMGGETSSPFHPERTQLEGAIYEPERGPSPDRDSAGTLTMGFLAFRTGRSEFLLFISCPIYSILLEHLLKQRANKRAPSVHLLRKIVLVFPFFRPKKKKNESQRKIG